MSIKRERERLKGHYRLQFVGFQLLEKEYHGIHDVSLQTPAALLTDAERLCRHVSPSSRTLTYVLHGTQTAQILGSGAE